MAILMRNYNIRIFTKSFNIYIQYEQIKRYDKKSIGR